MATVSEIQTCINNLTTASDPAEFAILATCANRATSNNLSFTVATEADLPDLVTNNIANGQIVFVTSLGVPVVARVYLYEWLSMDGSLVRKDGLAYVPYAWGCNTTGQLGDLTVAAKSSPVVISGRGTTWCQISAGYHTAAVKTDGSAWTWGRNNYGQLGDNTTVCRSSPVAVTHASGNTLWCQISAGSYHTAAVKTNGSAWTWGRNNSGELGDNTGGVGTNKSSPVAVVHASGNTCWRQISAGGGHTAAIKLEGTTWTAWTWGSNICGRLGDGSVLPRSSPVTLAGGGDTWCQIHAGVWHTAAVKTTCDAWTWGRNDRGQLGDNTILSKSSPVQVVHASGNTLWCQISAGYHTAGIKTDGRIWTWGLNNYGQLGDNTIVCRSSPVLTSGIGLDWCAIDAGSCQTAAVKTDGTIWTWGSNTAGQLGNGLSGAGTNRSSPGTISGNLRWCTVSAGNNFTVGIQPN
jgi:alpha-tubulin suppressor-like RCC1 family protein